MLTCLIVFMYILVGCSESNNLSQTSYTYLPKEQAIAHYVKQEGLEITGIVKLDLTNGRNLVLIEASNQIYFVGQLHESHGNYVIERITSGVDASEMKEAQWSMPILNQEYTISVKPAHEVGDHVFIEEYGLAVAILQEDETQHVQSLIEDVEVWL